LEIFLVAVDSSKGSQLAFNKAVAQLRPEDTLIVATVVVRVISYPGANVPGAQDYSAMVFNQMKKAAIKLLLNYGAQLSQNGFSNFSLLLTVGGHVGDAILQTVEKKKVDFLYVGCRGLGPIERLLLGSVSKHLVEHANCTVIVVKDHQKNYGASSDLPQFQVEHAVDHHVAGFDQEEEKWRSQTGTEFARIAENHSDDDSAERTFIYEFQRIQ